MNPMSLLKHFRRWLGESRRNQFLAAAAALVAGGTLAAVGVVVGVSGDADRLEQVIVRSATPSPPAQAPTRTPRRAATATASPTAEPGFQGMIYFTAVDVAAKEYVGYSIKPDGTELTKFASPPSGGFGCALSPDARLCAFVETETTAGATHVDDDISIWDIATGKATNITNTPPGESFTNDEVFPVWSPDGGSLAFVTRHLPLPSGPAGATDYASLEVMAADGSGRRSLLSEDEVRRLRTAITSLEWAPDGSAVIFRMLATYDDFEGGHLFLVKQDGSGLKDISRVIINMDVGNAAWRPDSAAIALVMDRLYLADISDHELKVFKQLHPSLSPAGFAWSPDGSKLALDLRRGTIAIINADGSGLDVLTEDANVSTSLAWSPDGTQIAYVAFGGPCREGCPPGPLAIINADGSGSRVLTEIPVSAILRWIPPVGEATENLNIRIQPTTDSPIVGSLNKGDKVGLSGQVDGEEAEPGSGNRIWFRTGRGYVYSGYVRR